MAARSEGEKRRRAAKRERERLRNVERMAALKAAGKSCGNCSSFRKAPFPAKGHICDFQSDFHGYVPVKADDLCPDWSKS